jgi:putative transposase
MARPLRIEFAGALYHVTARGNERRTIFFNDEDRLLSLSLLGEVCADFNWRGYAYCQMTNQYHLLVETLDANLSKGMRQLNGVYTQAINRTHRRVGHLFQGRFVGILIEKETYLLELARYIVLNPVRARRVTQARDWAWSSYCATVGLGLPPPFLTTDWLLSAFGAKQREARVRFERFVADGMEQPSPWRDIRHQTYLGSDRFVESMQQRIKDDQPLEEIPVNQKRTPARPLSYYAEIAQPVTRPSSQPTEVAATVCSRLALTLVLAE